jgi:hypothetical protein
MKENLEAKFYDLIFKATREELPEITKIDFVVDMNIENPSNKEVVDCSNYFKEFSKKSKKTI